MGKNIMAAQASPINNSQTPTWLTVMSEYSNIFSGTSQYPFAEELVDLFQERDSIGRERYGTPLQPFNGRNSLLDAIEESLDKIAYLRNAISEQEGGMKNYLWDIYRTEITSLENLYIVFKKVEENHR